MAKTVAFNSSDPSRPAVQARTLIVDNNDVFRASLRELLHSAGHAVSQAADGRAALAVAARERPHVVVLDVRMPALHGYEVCRRLRLCYGYSMAIIFLSGSRVEPYDRVAGLEAGGDDYLTKPFDPGELLARIAAQLRRLRSTNEAVGAKSPLTPRQEQIVSRGSHAAPTSVGSHRSSSSPPRPFGSTSSESTRSWECEIGPRSFPGRTSRASPRERRKKKRSAMGRPPRWCQCPILAEPRSRPSQTARRGPWPLVDAGFVTEPSTCLRRANARSSKLPRG